MSGVSRPGAAGHILVIETAAAACSVALLAADGSVVDHRHELVGRGHAERLVPMIAGLMAGDRADALLVDCGPGSFTGIRVGIAAARGLAIGWGVPVHGFGSTQLLAATVAADPAAPRAIAIVLEGGHGEVFVQPFDGALAAGPLASLTPAAAAAAIGDRPAYGTGVRWLERDGTELVPDARGAALLSAADRAWPPLPVYGRAPDARPMAAR